MIKIKTVAIKNFISVGNVTQAINLSDVHLTLVLGENVDLGGGGNRNGVGKSTIVEAISYGLFGFPISKISMDNLINKTNKKGMLVVIEFEKGQNVYRIERGRKPNVLRFFVNDKKVEEKNNVDEAHGDGRITQREIDRVIGLSRELFKNIIALNTTTIPFLSQGAGAQRTIIEELLGVTQLSEKALLLKDQQNESKELIKEEEMRIGFLHDSNAKIQENIDHLNIKSKAWKTNHQSNSRKLEKAIKELEYVNIDAEIESHKTLTLYKELESAVSQFKTSKKSEERIINQLTSQSSNLAKQVIKAEEHNCPTCGQEIHDDKHEEILTELSTQYIDVDKQLNDANENLANIETEIKLINGGFETIGDKPETYYDSIDEAYNHRTSLDSLRHRLETENEQKNPFTEQIEQLEETGIQEIDYTKLNTATRLKEHQDFLYKVLTDKKSFVRKKIIDQNLSYLNHRLNYYLEKLGLPHEVRFLNDLSVEITELGNSYDFDNLSRGEKNRVILGLSWAFRDIWENLNDHINLMFVDELIDNGIDQIGVENALAVLKHMGRDKGKDVFLISHKEELIGRVAHVLSVKKEGGFTAFEADNEKLS